MKLMNNKLKLIPLNNLTQFDVESSDKFRLFFEQVKSMLLPLALLNESLEQKNEDMTMQCEALREAVNSETKSRDKAEKAAKDLEKTIAKLNHDKDDITKNYQEQIHSLSEQLLALMPKQTKKQ